MPINQLIELVRTHQTPGMAVAEIGVWDGDSSRHWIPIVHQNQGRSVLVDYFRGNPTAQGPHSYCDSRRDDVARLLAQRIRPFDNVMVIEGDSSEASSLVEDRSLDICFLDADHRYSRISRDIIAWKPKVKVGGILCGHDYDSPGFDGQHIETDFVGGKHHGVIKAVDELVALARFLPESCWYAIVTAPHVWTEEEKGL